MKTVVLASDLPAANVIDSGVYKEYTKLLEKDIAAYFSKGSALAAVNCPGCGKQEIKGTYQKMGMNFNQCAHCGSHYVSPRPDPKTLHDFYRDSRACRFWREQIAGLPDSQLYYIYGPRVNWISELVDEFLPEASVLMDFGTKYSFLLRHIREKQIFQHIAVYKPELFEHTDSLSPDILSEGNWAPHQSKVSVFTAFEVVERVFDPEEVFATASRFCRPGGLMLLTTASCTGFEYQVLGKQAPNINPVNRMNLLSIEALTGLIQKGGFEILEFSTPGRLDVDIVKETIENSKELDIDPFWKYIFKFREEKTLDSLQNFLQENRLSSHVRIAARKK